MLYGAGLFPARAELGENMRTATMTLDEYRAYVIEELNRFCEYATNGRFEKPGAFPKKRKLLGWEEAYRDFLEGDV